MNRDDILQAAQQNKKGSEYEQRSELKSSLLSAISALIVGAFLFFFEYLKNGSFNWEIAAIVLTALATQILYEGIKLKRMVKVIGGIILTILALLALVTVVAELVR